MKACISTTALLMLIWASTCFSQTICDRVKEIRTLPFKNEPVQDAAFNDLLASGDTAVPCLVEKVLDEREMKDPRQAPRVASAVRVGDVAYFALVRIAKIGFVEMLPCETQEEYENEGVQAYFDFVSSSQNRKWLHEQLVRWRDRKSQPECSITTVRKTAERFLNAFRNLEWNEFRSFFAEHSTAFFPPSAQMPHRVNGKEQIEAVFRKVFDNARKRKSEPPFLVIEPLELKIQMLGDVAVVTFELDDPDLLGRRTVIFQKRREQWLILHLHASGSSKVT